MIKIKTKIVYSVLTLAVVFLLMTVFEVYEARKIRQNYKAVTLEKFKKEKFRHYSQNSEEEERVKIHISGAVKNPGFYEVEPGIKLKRIINSIIILREDADLAKINLNKKIYKKDQIIIPHN
ncbi:MAG TPA: hypothetical protein VKN64_08275 [Halanaerobiales bacterium]|nr:hypothetical protein [Halanaerobiales bacterium]